MASDFIYNWNSREAITSIAYDYLLDQQVRFRFRFILSIYIKYLNSVDSADISTSFVINQCLKKKFMLMHIDQVVDHTDNH